MKKAKSIIKFLSSLMHSNLSSSQPSQGVYFKNGSQYDVFRPVYPSHFIEKIRKAPKQFNNYLDIATGTGQVLFQVHDIFNELTLGADISESMINVARQKAESLKSAFKSEQDMKFLHGDCQKIDELIRKANTDKRFDLITIGEAFHWFEMEPLLQTIKNNLITEDGVLAILSYFIGDIELRSSNMELAKQVSDGFLTFYKTVTVYSKFSQEVLYSGYANVPFEKYFSIKKEKEIEKIPSSLEEVIGHLGTWSMYNTYVEKHSKEEGYKDPLLVFGDIMKNALKEIESDPKNLNDPHKPFFMTVPYQLILASNSI